MPKNTLDLDYCDKETLYNICNKINICPSTFLFDILDTAKGYHIIFYCVGECDICRFVFDDSNRYSMDFKKEPQFKNVLFEAFSFTRRKLPLTDVLVKPKTAKQKKLSGPSQHLIH